MKPYFLHNTPKEKKYSFQVMDMLFFNFKHSPGLIFKNHLNSFAVHAAGVSLLIPTHWKSSVSLQKTTLYPFSPFSYYGNFFSFFAGKRKASTSGIDIDFPLKSAILSILMLLQSSAQKNFRESSQEFDNYFKSGTPFSTYFANHCY